MLRIVWCRLVPELVRDLSVKRSELAVRQVWSVVC